MSISPYKERFKSERKVKKAKRKTKNKRKIMMQKMYIFFTF